MSHYLEVWLRGYAKDRLRELSVNEECHPHITLVRPFTPHDEGDTVDTIISFCQEYEPIPFALQGAGSFDGTIRYVPVVEAERLLEFNDGLEEALTPVVAFKPKLNDEKILHATVYADARFDCERIGQYMLRLTAIKEKRIWFSYDFVLQQSLTREESLDKSFWYRTVHLFSDKYHLLPTRNGFKKF